MFHDHCIVHTTDSSHCFLLPLLHRVVTLEDVLENLIQEQIYDEFDRKEKQRFRLASWGFKRWKMFVKKKKKQRGESTAAWESTTAYDTMGEPKMIGIVDKAMGQATETTSLLGRLNPFR